MNMPKSDLYLKIEIDKTPLSEAVTAVAGRLKTPALLDHNALARVQVDWNMKVALPETNTYYLHALDRLPGILDVVVTVPEIGLREGRSDVSDESIRIARRIGSIEETIERMAPETIVEIRDVAKEEKEGRHQNP